MEINTEHPYLEFLPNAVENIRRKYDLDEGRIEQSVDILEDWMRKQNHFLNKNFSRRYLDITVIACKGSVEKAKKQIDKLCTFKTLLPKYFISSGVKSICDRINEIAHVIVLPKMTKDYQRVFVLKINNKQFTSSHYLEYYRLVLLVSEYLKRHDYVDGVVAIEDFRDVNIMDLMTKMNFIEFQQCMAILIEGFGARLKGIHIISQSKVVDMFIKTIKSLLSEKLGNRIYVHSEPQDVYQVVDRKLLPVDFGGEERSIKELQGELTKLICSKEHEEYLEVMKASGTDESQRQTDKFNEQHMGLPGSFRTLTVD